MRNLSKRLFILFAVLFLATAYWFIGSRRGTPVQSEVRIGALLALTGDEAKYGQWAKEAIDLAVEEVNESGGINGARFNVIYEDSLSSNNGSVGAMRKMIDVEKLSVIIGPTRSASTLACAPIANKHQVVLITPTAGSPKIADAGDYIFRTRESGDLQARALARYIIQELNLERVSVLYPQEANALGYKNAFVDEFKRNGKVIVSIIAFPEDKSDLRSEIQKILASNPSAVYIPGTAIHIGRAIRQCKELGGDVRFFSSVGVENPEVLKIAGEATEGLIYSGMAFDSESENQEVADFVEKYTSKYGRKPNAWAANAYDAAMIIVSILKKGIRDGLGVKDQLYIIKNYQGVSGTITFDEKGEAVKSIGIKEIRNQQFVFVRR